MPKTFHDLHAQLKEATESANATKIESIIVDVVNTGSTRIRDSKIGDGTVAGAIAVGKDVVSYLKTKSWSCKKANMSKRGTISKNWQTVYGDTGADTTARTDIVVDDKRVSIKKGPGQLMSGTIAETRATFWAALGDIALRGKVEMLSDKTTIAINKCLEKMQRKLPKKIKINGKLVDNPNGGQSFDRFTAVGKGRDLNKTGSNPIYNYIDAFQEEVTQLFIEAFEKSPELKVAFVKEALSGQRKFVSGSEAIAEYLLSTAENGTSPVIHIIDDRFAKAVASKCSVACRFKTGSEKSKSAARGSRAFSSVFGANVDTSEVPEEIIKQLVKLHKKSVNFQAEINNLNKKTTPNHEAVRGKKNLMVQQANDARNLLQTEPPLATETIKRIIDILLKKDTNSKKLAAWITNGMTGNLPESLTPTNLNTLTESMMSLYEQELITEQELVEGMIDWLGAISNSITNNATVAMAFGLRRTENMGSDVKNIADTFGIEVDIQVGKNEIDWNSIA